MRVHLHSLVLLDHVSSISSILNGLIILMSYIAQNSAGIFIHSRWSDCPAPEIDQEASETESETSTMDNHRQESSGSSNFTQKDLLFAIPRQLSDAQQVGFHSKLLLILQLTLYM